MSSLKNDRYIKAALRQPVDMTPVWMMRQAGRYLPEYRALRAEAGNFMALATNPELACEVTLQPLRRFELDAAILFSDILTIPDAMGLGLHFVAGEGPAFEKPVRSEQDVNNLFVPDPFDKLSYVTDAVSTIRKALNGDVPLIGFSGSPWTLATYMVEGGATKNFSEVKSMMFKSPAVMHKLLDVLADSVIVYLNAQIESGAQAVMVFDTWGGVLSPADYQEFSLRYMQKIVDGLKRNHDGQTIPVTLFTKNAGDSLALMAETGCDCLGVDWTTDLSTARQLTQDKVALQGNMDPSVLYASPERIREQVSRILTSYGSGPGHVFNLGHGIHQTVDPENAKVFVDAIHELSVPFHQK
ncbi:MAG: uroporphyrinogen decarboxylase [Kangiellaceae bacterium]|nr:uroporphyrinogen decarboxylase [Kangiellaceae bacterium]